MKPKDKKIKCPLCNHEGKVFLNENYKKWFMCFVCSYKTPLFRVKKIYNEINKK